MRPRRAPLTLALALTTLAGCATIVHGGSQEIGLSSMPAAARVLVDGKPLGATPIVAKLSRKTGHVIRMELDGYQPFEANITRAVSGWAWGNLVFGGIIGIAVDQSSGGMYKLTPAQVAGQLAAAHTGAADVLRDGVYVTVVLRPDPAWQKVGTLTRE
jgi:CRISPR/Cas system-associated exonuclease Cas4 (RecB family)